MEGGATALDQMIAGVTSDHITAVWGDDDTGVSLYEGEAGTAEVEWIAHDDGSQYFEVRRFPSGSLVGTVEVTERGRVTVTYC